MNQVTYFKLCDNPFQIYFLQKTDAIKKKGTNPELTICQAKLPCTLPVDRSSTVFMTTKAKKK